MRNLKRALSLALASVMLVGMMVVGTSAASFSDVDSDHNVEAISVLQALGVMNGYDDGGFHPEANVTRNQMAMIICALLGLDGADFTGYRPFTDVPDWAAGAVGACYVNEIVGGRGEGIYDGDAYVTGVEAAAMMLRALGYTEMPASSNWETPVIQKAAEIKLFKNLGSVNGNTFLNRDAVAQVALNALKADVVTTVKNGGDITIGDTTINLGNLEYKKVETDATGYTGDTDTNSNDYKYQQLCEKLYEDKLLLKSTGETDKLGRPAKTWEYDGKDIITVADDAKYTVVVNEKKANMALNEWAKEANKKLTIGGGADITGNGIASVTDRTNLQIGDVVEFYDVTDNVASTVVVTRYSVGKIDEIKDCNPNVKKDKEAMEDDGASVVVTVKSGATFGTSKKYYDTDITGFAGGDYVEGAYIAYVAGTGTDSGKLIASYIPETTDGKVTAVDTKNSTITVDKTKYTIADTDMTDLGNEYTLVLDKEGYVIGAEEIEAADVDLSDVLYIVKPMLIEEQDEYGNDVNTIKVQTVSMDGVAQIYSLYTCTGSLSGTLPATKPVGMKDGEFIAATDIAEGKFITVEENEDTQGLWDATAQGSINISDDYEFATAITGSNQEMDKDDTKLFGSSVRVNGETKYVVAEKNEASLKVYQATGGIEHKLISGEKATAIVETVNNTKVALYVVLDTDAYNSETSSKDVVYVDADADYQKVLIDGAKGNFYQFDIYGPDGDTMTVVAKDYPGAGHITAGFKTYSIKETGDDSVEVYTFKNDSPLDTDLPLSAAYDDEKGIVTGKQFKSSYKTELSMVNENNYLDNIETKDAAFVDLHNTDVYGESILDLDAMYQAGKDGYNVTLSVYLNKGAKLIVVTGVEKKPHEHNYVEKSGVTVKAATCTEDGQEALYICDREGCGEAEGTTWTRSGSSGSYTYTKGDGVITKTGHTAIVSPSSAADYVNKWDAAGSTWQHAVKCQNCNEAAADSWANCSDGGVGDATCDTCEKTNITTAPST